LATPPAAYHNTGYIFTKFTNYLDDNPDDKRIAGYAGFAELSRSSCRRQ